MAIQQQISDSINATKLGQVLDVLIEEKVEGESVYVGRTKYDSPEVDGIVYVNTERVLEIGTIIKCKITDTMEYDLIGECYDEHC